MKYLILLGVLALVYFLWRKQRPGAAGGNEGAARPAPPPQLAQDMVRCPVCAVHLPQADAVAGPQGRLYCSAEHRRSGEG